MPTGYKWMDKKLGGGWLVGGRSLYMFMGATNVGKSIVLGNIAAKACEFDRTTVVLSLEMPEQVYSKRISSQLSRIPFKALGSDTNNLNDYLYNFKHSHSGSKLIIKEFPPSTINANHISAYLKKLVTKKKVKPDLIIIDYLTLLLAIEQSGSMYQEGLDVAEQIRALSYPEFFGCPIISAGQINRSGFEEANPSLDKTGESIGIPQTADAVFSLWQTESEKELGVLNCGIRKNRFGVNHGTQAFRIDYDTLAIDEMEDVFSNNDTMQDTDNKLSILSDG
jgi:replicative DNA helicase